MVRKIFTVICALVLFFGCGELLQYVLVDDTRSYTRIMLHEMYTSKKNVDIAVVGSSHVYRSFVPKIMDEGFGVYTFNAGSSNQQMDGSFAMIQELCANHHPKRIFLELSYHIAAAPENKNRTEMVATYILSDYMKLSWRKVRYLLNASSKMHYMNSFVIARRNWKKIFDIAYMTDLIKKKQSEAYKSYCWVHEDKDKDSYIERGFVASDEFLEDGMLWNKRAYSRITKTSSTNNDWDEMLLRIIQYCKAKNVELTIIIAPMPEWSFVGVGNYQEYHDFVQGIANQHGLEFCDFNLCKATYFDTDDKRLFVDEVHLNRRGAEKFSAVFVDYFTGKVEKNALFYKTLKEKLGAEQPKVYGFAGLPKNGRGRVISNREHGMEYRLEVTPQDGVPRVIQDYSEEKEFSIPKDEHGKLVLLWRMKGEEREEKSKIETEY